jgi:hypothetical protein
MAPLADQTWQKILMLSQFNLEFSFMGSGFSGKYVQNQGGTINDFDSQYLFEVSLLPRRKLIVKDHRVVLSWLSEAD